MTSQLMLCETCGGADADQPEAPRKGALFADQVERLARQQEEAGAAPLAIARTRCLMACQRHCTALLRGPGKIGYVLGDLAADQDAAEALLDYARKHQQSDTGQVPFRTWPAGIKGKFIARIPVFEQ